MWSCCMAVCVLTCTVCRCEIKSERCILSENSVMEDKRHEAAETTTWTGSSWFYFTDKYCRWEKQANLSFTSIRTTENCDVNRCKLRNYKFDISLVSIFRLIQHCDPSCSVQSHRFPFYRWTTVSLSTKITFVQTPVVWSGQTWPLNRL